MKCVCPQKLYINLSKYSLNLSKINVALVSMCPHAFEGTNIF